MKKGGNIVGGLPNLLVGLITILIGLLLATDFSGDVSTLFSLLFLLLICLTDTIKARIPNYLTFTCIIGGMVFHSLTSHLSGFTFSLAGFSLGIGLFLIPFLMGGMGAGDVKALAALGALIGAKDIFNVFLFTGMIGGVLAVLHYALNRNLGQKASEWGTALFVFAGTRKIQTLLPTSTDEKLRFPYAAAIALGYYVFLTWGSLI